MKRSIPTKPGQSENPSTVSPCPGLSSLSDARTAASQHFPCDPLHSDLYLIPFISFFSLPFVLQTLWRAYSAQLSLLAAEDIITKQWLVFQYLIKALTTYQMLYTHYVTQSISEVSRYSESQEMVQGQDRDIYMHILLHLAKMWYLYPIKY